MAGIFVRDSSGTKWGPFTDGEIHGWQNESDCFPNELPQLSSSQCGSSRGGAETGMIPEPSSSHVLSLRSNGPLSDVPAYYELSKESGHNIINNNTFFSTLSPHDPDSFLKAQQHQRNSIPLRDASIFIGSSAWKPLNASVTDDWTEQQRQMMKDGWADRDNGNGSTHSTASEMAAGTEASKAEIEEPKSIHQQQQHVQMASYKSIVPIHRSLLPLITEHALKVNYTPSEGTDAAMAVVNCALNGVNSRFQTMVTCATLRDAWILLGLLHKALQDGMISPTEAVVLDNVVALRTWPSSPNIIISMPSILEHAYRNLRLTYGRRMFILTDLAGLPLEERRALASLMTMIQSPVYAVIDEYTTATDVSALLKRRQGSSRPQLVVVPTHENATCGETPPLQIAPMVHMRSKYPGLFLESQLRMRPDGFFVLYTDSTNELRLREHLERMNVLFPNYLEKVEICIAPFIGTVPHYVIFVSLPSNVTEYHKRASSPFVIESIILYDSDDAATKAHFLLENVRGTRYLPLQTWQNGEQQRLLML